MIALERRYVLLLRLLPKDYRQEWEQDMLATFLQSEHARLPDDEADLDMYGPTYPRWAEIGSVARLAVGVRLGTAGPHPSPRAAAWGAAVRLVALIGLLVPAAFALAVVPTTLMSSLMVPRGQVVLTVGVGAGWIASFVCLVVGRQTWAKILAATAFLVTLVPSAIVQAVDGLQVVALVLPYWLGIAIPVVALVAWQPTVAVPSRWWLAALPAATAILIVVNVPAWFGVLVYWDLPGALCLAATLSAVALPAMARRHVVTALSGWLAVALLGTVAAIVRGLSLVWMLSTPASFEGFDYLTLGVAIQAAVAALVAALGVVHIRRLGRTISPGPSWLPE